MPAGTYEIDMTWPAAANLTTKLGLDLYDGVGNWTGQIVVNERVAPSDFTDQGVEWKRLGSFKLTNNIFHVSTWNSPTDGAIAIDALRLRAAPTVNDGDTQISGRGGALSGSSFTTSGSWSSVQNGSQTSSKRRRQRFQHRNVGHARRAGHLRSAGHLGGRQRPVGQRGLQRLRRRTKLGSVSVSQKSAPSGLADDGISWQSLGSFTVSGTVLKVVLANTAADGQVSAEAVRLVPAYQPQAMVGSGTPGSWYNSNWTTINQGLYGTALVSSGTPGDETSQAAWWFPCRPGQYEVDVTWQPD